MDSANGYRWQLPVVPEGQRKQLTLLNSFTRKKEKFIPIGSKTIKWYSCGPTVYDVAHLGHARCYITFDIIRRVLSQYFGYHVFYVMNITDIDDKIIKRARGNYLCDKYISDFVDRLLEYQDVSDQLRSLTAMVASFREQTTNETDPAKVLMRNTMVENSFKSIESMRKSLENITINKRIVDESVLPNLEVIRDIIASDQDAKLGSTVNDHEIFKALTNKFELEYHEDMQRLGVLPPHTLTRVSEYIQEIGVYIKKLEANGFAYRSGGSIYFDTERFDSDPKHFYAKLVREAYGHKKDLDEGEGELSVANQDKKSPNDFALWKKSKPGEPCWKTEDFEDGRPGWHIECSVMASNLLGQTFDIHSGGIDLKFPHHDNEIAQAEAYYNTGKNWVNYFLHSGHLSISGCKMSKSLKNFVTIRQALNDYTARQLRFAFLTHAWTETLDYSSNTMSTALSYERTFREFFLNVSDAFRRGSQSYEKPDCFKKWSTGDVKLNAEFLDTVDKIDEALSDNVDTRTSLTLMSNLVKECNKREKIDLLLLKDIACYIKRMLDIYGATFNELNLWNFSSKSEQQESSNTSTASEKLQVIDCLAKFRSDIRRISKGSSPEKSIKDILGVCDSLRDVTLPELGIRLEDKESGDIPYAVKLVDKETLARERELASQKEEEKRIEAEAQKLEQLKLLKHREDKAKIPPQDMFKSQTDKYSKFDANGLPTHDSTGKEISKSALKKLQRLFAEQETRYNKYRGALE